MSQDELATGVAFLGPAATFSHEAALQKFETTGRSVNYLPAKTIAQVFQLVAEGQADYGVVPVENSLEGAVTYTLDMFGQSELKIVAELELPIRQHLMVAPDGPANLETVQLVYSHPQALAQCRGWLETNLKWATTQEVSSTAYAAQLAQQHPQGAAIAGQLVAQTYNMHILSSEIQDTDFNFTRFLVIHRDYSPRISQNANGAEKTALMLSIKDRVGALHAVTSTLLKYNLNMTRIESRPSKQKAWDYVFFIDLLGHPQDPAMAQALDELASQTVWVKVLGAWSRTNSGH